MKTLFKLVGSTVLVVGMLGVGTITAQAATPTGNMQYSADCGVKELRMNKRSL